MADILCAEARLSLADPAGLLPALVARLGGAVETTPAGAVVRHPRLGVLTLAVAARTLAVGCAAPSAAALGWGKMAVAEALAALAPEHPAFAWTGDAAGARDLPFFREMVVAGAFQVTPRLRRVVLAGDAAHFARGGLHARVLIPPAGRAPVWPHADAEGRMVWPQGADALVPRVYTVRAVDTVRGEIALDVALHEGPGARWARAAAPGDRVGLLGPGGAAPEPAPWQLYAGDETALPAIARLLEELPAGARAVVRIEVADPAEEQALASPASVDLRWLHRGGAPAGTTRLLDRAIDAVAFPDDPAAGRVFAGCEQATARRLRALVPPRSGIDKTRCMIAAYWRLGHAGVDVGE
ncbi:siderophore-interacting protein [Xanthobacter sp. V4C-4]|uniref:siderophore-interacting protein n=1 Tax=Xanthobacter cornucopiae TaxID=3119924 RepID=UPI003726E18B